MTKAARNIVAFFAGLMIAGTSQAFEVAVEFSAKAVQIVPTRPEYQAQMYVSKNAVRTESVINNIPVVEIINADKQIRLLLVPRDKIYLQHKSDKPLSVGMSSKSASKNPCKGMADTTCKKLGNEKINNRKTEKWEFIVKRNEQNYRSLHWIDVERRMPIREFFPDGTVTELLFKGKEQKNNRKTEKWLMQMTRADGQQMTSTQWYDPELKMTIREEMQGGFVRELREIKTGKQDARLFDVPAGYKKVEQLPDYLRPQQPAVRPQ
jgi:hypothetical protein